MKLGIISTIVLLIILAVGTFYFFTIRQKVNVENSPSPIPVHSTYELATPTQYPDTEHAIQAFLAEKYSKPLSEVNVTVNKEVPGFASGSVMFGQGGPGEGGMWLAVLGNGWDVVWDGNGNVDCTKMRQDYGFPDTILVPNFCN